MSRRYGVSPFTTRILWCLIAIALISSLSTYVFIGRAQNTDNKILNNSSNHTLKIEVTDKPDIDLPIITPYTSKEEEEEEEEKEEKEEKEQGIELPKPTVRFEDTLDVYNQTEPLIKHTLQCEYIDIIYTWVNGSDPIHHDIRKNREKQLGIHSSSDARVRDLMGLKYSLRSIKKHVPWVRKVFVISDNQYPSWFNQSNTDIQFIFHQDYYKNISHLPTYNSNSLEINFYNLPDYVSDCFLYFNDDTFVANDLPMDYIWDQDRGQALYFSNWKAPQEDPNKIKKNSWHRSIHNTNVLLDGLWGNASRNYHSHTIVFYNKQLLKRIASVFPAEFAETSSQPFRKGSDVNNPFIYHQFAKRYYNHFRPERKDYYSTLTDDVEKTKNTMAKIIEHKHHTVCLNDGFGKVPNQDSLAVLKESFEILFPEVPPWELKE